VATLAAGHPQVIPAFGMHPWFVADRPGDWLERLEELLVGVPAAAVGEIGLDHAVEPRNDADQAGVFTAQLRLARRLGRPLSIHCRRAFGDMLRILTEQCGLPHGGAIHSFSGSPDLIAHLAALNVSFSFSGSILHGRNRRGRACAAAVPESRLLIETDSPDLAPPGFAPGENEPANAALVAGALSTLRERPPEEIASLTTGNATRLFVRGESGTLGECGGSGREKT
jgi:TatD DNase family protein